MRRAHQQNSSKLEREREQLLTQVHEVEAVSTRFSNRYAEMEEELSTLANLYVASYQLHSTLRPEACFTALA